MGRHIGFTLFLRFLGAFSILALMGGCSPGSSQSQGSEKSYHFQSNVLQDIPEANLRSPESVENSIFHETMADMTWPEIAKGANQKAIILMTTAVIEEHGPHMSCGIDAYLGYTFCKEVKDELESRGIRSLIAPPFYWGINRSSHVFPGTFTVREETMMALLHDILASLKSWGFLEVYNINAHGERIVGTSCRFRFQPDYEASPTSDLRHYVN